MQDTNEEKKPLNENEPKTVSTSKDQQEKSDPQLTELRGFLNPDEDLEPTLQDGTKSPDKG